MNLNRWFLRVSRRRAAMLLLNKVSQRSYQLLNMIALLSKTHPSQPDQSSNVVTLLMQPVHQPIAINDRFVLSETHPSQPDQSSNVVTLQMQPAHQPIAVYDRSILLEIHPIRLDQCSNDAALQMQPVHQPIAIRY
nr:unnamed protein product [Haemonchus contortus]